MSMRALTLLVAAALASPLAGAGELLDAYGAARANDATFLGARHELAAGQQALPLARAGLLPTVSASVSRSKVDGSRTSGTSAAEADLDYRSKQDALSLRQPLFNAEAWTRYKIGEIQQQYAEALFRQQEIELGVRFMTAYLAVLLEDENIALAEAERAAVDEQRRQAQRRLDSGEGTRTEVAEAEARLRIAEAALVAAHDRLQVARSELGNITGTPDTPVRAFREGFVAPAEKSLDEWVATARETNAEIAGLRYGLEAAEREIDRARAGHLPRVELVASVSKSSSETVNLLDQDVNTRSIGVQLNLPLYAGGYTSALTEQAIAKRDKAQADLDAALRKVSTEVGRRWMAMRNGADKAAAYDRAAEAAELALVATRKGREAGIRTIVDVLDAQRAGFSARFDAAQARLEYLLNLVRLKAAAGTLSEQDLAALDHGLRAR